MVRRPAEFASTRLQKVQKTRTLRNYGAEAQLCEAIRKRVFVELRYDAGSAYRLVAPYVVFQTEDGDVCLSCYQVENPEKPMDNHQPRSFTVAKISALRLTEVNFAIDPRFNLLNSKFRHGVLCRVQ